MADRILIYGVSGCGKSMLARQVAARTGLPFYSVDDLTWEPGWVKVPAEEQRRRMTEICETDHWVLDSAYRSWIDLPLARAELIVALDYPRWLSLSRLVRRSLLRITSSETICNGNTESVRALISGGSIIAWHFQTFGEKRRRMRAWAANPPGPAVSRFRSPRAARRWLDGLEASCDSADPALTGRDH